MSRERTVQERFWNKVNKSDGCWEWSAGRLDSGYGRFRLDGRMLVASRVAYSLTFGAIPDGLSVLHSCDNPPCVNPKHLRTGTRSENMQEMVARGRNSTRESDKTRCKYGHPYDEPNTYHNPSGSRACRTCGRIGAKRRFDAAKQLKEQSL